MNTKITFQTRELSPDERRMLKSLHTRTQKAAVGWVKLWHYPVAAALGAACALAAFHTDNGFLIFLCGTIAVFAAGFVVFTPFEVLKQHRERRDTLCRLSAFIGRGTVGVHPVSAARIAIAREYEDEGDFYIVELADAGGVLYIADIEYNMGKKFPCLRFEVYDDEFFALTGRRVLPLGERVEAVEISGKAKWAYWTAYGVPDDLTVEDVPFDTIVERYRAAETE